MEISQQHLSAAALESHLSVAATTQYGTWVSYAGSARIVLTVILIAAAGGVALLGTRLPLPMKFARRGRRAMTALLVTWVLAVLAWFAGFAVYVEQLRHDHLVHAAPVDNPITPVSVIGVGVIFVVIALSSPRAWRTTLASAAVGAVGALAIFELPFDLIVMARIYPAVPPDPALYRAVFFVPLFLIEVMTLALLTCSPLVRLSRATCYLVALMLAVFAIWALVGFGYPSTPADIALNVISKIVAFVAALSMFLPVRAQRQSPAAGTDPLERSREYAGGLFGQDAPVKRP
jgi:hypothetical protein